MLRPPSYRACLVDAHRDLVRQRLAEKLPVTRILAEIREHGYAGSANLLVRYINQGQADPERVTPAPRRLVTWIMSRPSDLPDHIRHLDDLIASCPEMTTLAERVRDFAAILTHRRGRDLPAWIATTRAHELPGFSTYLNGLDKDLDAAVTGLTLPHSNGPVEGINTKNCPSAKPTAKPDLLCYARESCSSTDYPGSHEPSLITQPSPEPLV